MVGTKRILPMEKIEKQDSRAVAFSKRRQGLYGKASELCLLSGSRIAILSTPVSTKSNASFYSFGHSSVDSVVSAFLENKSPRDDLGLGLWWEDESLRESENLDELRDALDSMEMMMNKVNDLKKKKKKKPNQTLSVDSSTASSIYIQEDLPANPEGFVKTSEEEKEGILAICDKKKKKDMDDYNLHLSGFEENHQILAISDKANNNGDIQERDLFQLIDLETESESLSTNDVSMMTTNQSLCSSYGSAEDGRAMVWYRDHSHLSNLDDDQVLNLSDSNKETRSVLSANLDGCLLMNWKMGDASMMNMRQKNHSQRVRSLLDQINF